jgi:hypothetical protein
LGKCKSLVRSSSTGLQRRNAEYSLLPYTAYSPQPLDTTYILPYYWFGGLVHQPFRSDSRSTGRRCRHVLVSLLRPITCWHLGWGSFDSWPDADTRRSMHSGQREGFQSGFASHTVTRAHRSSIILPVRRRNRRGYTRPCYSVSLA